MPFTRENVPASSSTSTAESVFMPEASFEAYMKIIKSLFNDEALKNVRLLNWEELLKDAFVKDGVLYLTPLDANQFIIGMLQNALECLLQSFSSKNVTLDMIRKAVKLEEPLPASKPHMGIERVLAKGLIQDCFCVQLLKNEDPEKADQAVVYFDIKTLWHMLFPPAVQYVLPENELYKDKAIFSFNTHEVLLYVRQLLNDGVFLRVYQSHEGQLTAKPMFLSGSPGVEKPRFHVLIVDRSGSLKDYWVDLQKNVIAYIDELRKIDPKAKLRIMFFETDIGPTKEFDISNKTTIDEFINQCKLGANTFCKSFVGLCAVHTRFAHLTTCDFFVGWAKRAIQRSLGFKIVLSARVPTITPMPNSAF
ncbi:MAG: hypothetical protein AB7F64_09855 [Gammaproteobacteria bacterium]